MKYKKAFLLAGILVLSICGGCSPSPDRETVDEAAAPKSPASITLKEAGNPPARPTDSRKAETVDARISDSQISDADIRKASGTSDTSKEISSDLEARLQSMTLEEKAAQLFIILPESLMDGVSQVTAAGEQTKKAFDAIPVGGFIYLGDNLQSPEQVKAMLSNVQSFSMERLHLPAFLSVDEEGGRVARIGGSGRFEVPVIGNMAEVGNTRDTDNAYQAGRTIGTYLSDLGFNLDFAPVADVLSNPENQVVKGRSFGADPENVSAMALAAAKGLQDQGVLSVYKHFPGHGATAGDTHAGYAYTEKTLEELKSCELIPFHNGIQAGIPIIMAGHFSLPQVTGDHVPASLSPAIITRLLREEMGFDGIIITDALNMGAIARQYSSAEAAVLALKAGNDMILMPADFKEAYQGVLDAVAQGVLTEERIDESVRRILRVKLAM